MLILFKFAEEGEENMQRLNNIFISASIMNRDIDKITS